MEQHLLALEEVKTVELSILNKFVKYCEEKQYVYTLTYGTLLGAIRHKGFIPWDDDIDVMMARSDYERFIRDFEGSSPIEGCELLIRGKSEGYFYPFAKLCDNSTTAKMDDNHTEHGIWVDVFPVDHVPDNEVEARKFHRYIRFFKNLIISYTTDFSTKYVNWKLVPKFIFAGIVRIVGVNRIAKYIEKESIKYNNSGTGKVAIVSWQSNEGGNMKEEEFLNPIKVDFDGIRVNSPADYDGYLSSIYGNYMQIPPENKRTTHHVIAYRKS